MNSVGFSNPATGLDVADFYSMAAEWLYKLRSLYPGKHVSLLGPYPEKDGAEVQSCNILVECSPSYNPFTAAEALGALEIIPKGHVTSIGVPVVEKSKAVFKVDLVRTPVEVIYNYGKQIP